MGININDLNGDLQPIGASLLSGNESIMDSLRELSDREQKISGGGNDTIVTGGFGGFGGFGGTPTIVTGGGKKGGETIVTGSGFNGFGGGETIVTGGGKKGGNDTIVTGNNFGGFGGFGTPTIVTNND